MYFNKMKTHYTNEFSASNLPTRGIFLAMMGGLCFTKTQRALPSVIRYQKGFPCLTGQRVENRLSSSIL